MEDSFKVRVEKVFGSLSDSQPLNALWSLTDEEIERKEWNRDKGPTPEDDLSGPFAIRPASSSSSRQGLIKDLEVENDEEDDDGPARRLSAKPDDHDDEEWLIRSSIGMDCTLDKEEEEDEYDKFAIGLEKTGDRLCMNQIHDYTKLPAIGRDDVPATRLGLKEDVLAIKEFDSYVASDGHQIVALSSNTPNQLLENPGSVKSILKKDDKKAENKSLKRVRFDAESASDFEEQTADRSVKFASRSGVDAQVSFPPPETDPRVPDYLRNPSKYTQYTLDSPDDMDDEESNRKAYMDFFNLIRNEKHADESQQAENMSDSPKPITFMPRKKAGDDAMEINDPSRKRSHKVDIRSKFASSVIAAADEACVMDEDETEVTPSCSSIPRKAQRQYRAKASLELLDE